MLWNDIFSNSTTKQEEMCEKLLCCFMLPVGTIALVGISTWQNPLISPHKTTSYIPQGYYSNWVILISLYIVLLPSQSCLYILHSFAFQCSVWVCLHASCLCPHVMYLFAPLWGKKKKSEPSEQQDRMFFFHHGLNQVVGVLPPTRCLFVHPSVRVWII